MFGAIIGRVVGESVGQPLGHRVVNSFLLVAGLAFGVAGVFCLLQRLYLAVTLLVFAIAGVYFFGYYLSRFRNLIREVFVPGLLFGVFSLGILWFVSGGLNGSVPAMFVLAAVILVAVVQGRYSVMLAVFVMSVFVCAVILESLFPAWVIPYPSESARRGDLIFTTLICCGVAGLVIGLLRRSYEAERKIAERASRARSEFLSTMSHEIRTPMNSVVGMTHLLLEDNPRPDQMENLQLLRFSAENLLTLLNDILDFSKLEAGKVNFEARLFSPRELLRSIHALLLPRAQEKGLQFDLWIADDVPESVRGDAMRLGQVLTNLAANAVKFTGRGTVRLEIEVAQVASVVAGAATTTGPATDARPDAASGATPGGESEPGPGECVDLEFRVIDTGIGIPADKRELIFEKFAQAASDTTRRYGGTGLGLAISRRLLELMGSAIQVESEVDRGSRFSFVLRLPVETRVADRAGLTREYSDATRLAGAGLASLQGARVLLVEDYEPNVVLASRFLRRWGLEFDTAANGREALERASAADYDVVLMDLQMPVMDGYEATRAIRAMGGKRARVPVIALTAAALPEEEARARAAGMSDYVTKPFNPQDLYLKIARALGR
jgi:signal transduction histidine kinase/CheY-like chemotaxis protein